jgi:hypothetical protein
MVSIDIEAPVFITCYLWFFDSCVIRVTILKFVALLSVQILKTYVDGTYSLSPKMPRISATIFL